MPLQVCEVPGCVGARELGFKRCRECLVSFAAGEHACRIAGCLNPANKSMLCPRHEALRERDLHPITGEPLTCVHPSHEMMEGKPAPSLPGLGWCKEHAKGFQDGLSGPAEPESISVRLTIRPSDELVADYLKGCKVDLEAASKVVVQVLAALLAARDAHGKWRAALVLAKVQE